MNISVGGSELVQSTWVGVRSISAPSHVEVTGDHAPFSHLYVALPVTVLPLAVMVTDCPEGVAPAGSAPEQPYVPAVFALPSHAACACCHVSVAPPLQPMTHVAPEHVPDGHVVPGVAVVQPVMLVVGSQTWHALAGLAVPGLYSAAPM
jgi:hypothetical protein